MNYSDFFRRFLAVRKCISCRKILDFDNFEEAFCPNCRLKWDKAKTNTCPICFKSAIECRCMPKIMSAAGAISLRKLIFYQKEKMNEPQNKIIYFIKRNKSCRTAGFLARELSKEVSEELAFLEIKNAYEEAVFVWVPRGVKAKIAHGFDQSELICKAAGKILNIPSVQLIIRQSGGEEQKKLGRDARAINIKNRFTISPMVDVPKDRVIILVDDVVTTGASMAECVKLLHKNGYRSIICMSIAQN